MGILDLFSLKGKNALVTGSGQGLGAGMAIAFAQAGANVTLHNYDKVLGLDDRGSRRRPASSTSAGRAMSATRRSPACWWTIR